MILQTTSQKKIASNDIILLSFLTNMFPPPHTIYKFFWRGCTARTLYKGPIQHLLRYLIKHNHKYYLEAIAKQFPSISKWTLNKHIHSELSSNYWNNPKFFEAQIKQLLKFCIGQYMGNIRKHLFWPRRFYHPYCTLCSIQSINTWTQVLFNCIQSHIHALRI